MRKMLTALVFLVLVAPTPVLGLTGEEVLKKIDQNMVVEQALTITRMIVHGRSGTRTITSRVWRKGDNKAFVEYLSPAREKGKKMLKLGNKLWNYVPEPHDRIITIAGHLLRQSVMGSDLSYEDVTENDALLHVYEADNGVTTVACRMPTSDFASYESDALMEIGAELDGIFYSILARVPEA